MAKRSRNRNSGFIYVICRDDEGEPFYKIGRTRDWKNRLSGIQTGSPHKLKVLICFATSHTREDEETLHKMFEGKRVLGEWFKLEEVDLWAIAEFTDKFEVIGIAQ